MKTSTKATKVEDMTPAQLNDLMKSGFLRWRDPSCQQDSADLEEELLAKTREYEQSKNS
jgi:hypothetical protein